MLLAWNARLGWFSFGNRARLGQGKRLYRLVGDSGQEAVSAIIGWYARDTKNKRVRFLFCHSPLLLVGWNSV